MTADQHRVEAEQCLSAADLSETDGDQRATDLLLRQALIHATLAAGWHGGAA